MKGLDDGQSKVEKSRKVQLKAKPPVLKSQVATKVSGINPRRDKTSQRQKKRLSSTADVEAKEASENQKNTLADDEELYREDEECGDDEYFK
ncbi:unnamed protein product [Prunus brigantina]